MPHRKTQIKASFLHMAKIQKLIILPMKTQGAQENKTVATVSTNKCTQFVRITIML